jgi:osmotically-inducible protein OsmY
MRRPYVQEVPMKSSLSIAPLAVSLALAAPAVLAQAQVVSPAASGSISGTSGTNPVNPAPSGVLGATGDATDNRGSTSFGDARATVSDSALMNSVVSAFLSDPSLRGADLQVQVSGGTVGVSGRALDEAQAQRAVQVAAEASHGAPVETHIGVH